MPFCVYLCQYLSLNYRKYYIQILRKKNVKLSMKHLFLRLSYLHPFCKMTLKPILAILIPFGPPPIAKWLFNLLGTNTLMLDSRGYMMQVQRGGKEMICIDAVITKDGLSVSSRLQKNSSLVGSLQQNGSHLIINKK
jgi:hypothetical protein